MNYQSYRGKKRLQKHFDVFGDFQRLNYYHFKLSSGYLDQTTVRGTHTPSSKSVGVTRYSLKSSCEKKTIQIDKGKPILMYTVIKECWSYQVIPSVVIAIVIIVREKIQNYRLYKIQKDAKSHKTFVFSRRVGRPGRTSWQRLEAFTTRWTSTQSSS